MVHLVYIGRNTDWWVFTYVVGQIGYKVSVCVSCAPVNEIKIGDDICLAIETKSTKLPD